MIDILKSLNKQEIKYTYQVFRQIKTMICSATPRGLFTYTYKYTSSASEDKNRHIIGNILYAAKKKEITYKTHYYKRTTEYGHHIQRTKCHNDRS